MQVAILLYAFFMCVFKPPTHVFVKKIGLDFSLGTASQMYNYKLRLFKKTRLI